MDDTQGIPEDRADEFRQLVDLLMEHASPDDAAAPSVAEWVARSALAPGHLWRAMGLESREEVRALMREHFPALEAANDRDMRWKMFLYKRICGWSGFNA